jgi:hypothetical protein
MLRNPQKTLLLTLRFSTAERIQCALKQADIMAKVTEMEMRTVCPSPSDVAQHEVNNVIPADSQGAAVSKTAPFTLLRGEKALCMADKYKIRRDQAIGAQQLLSFPTF